MKQDDFILAIDQGTTGTTALLLDKQLTIRGKVTVEFPQHFPRPSWVEHDLDEIWSSVLRAVRGALDGSRIDPKRIAAIGITNQRETTCLWETGPECRPASRAIVWQDRRTADICDKLKKRGLEKTIRKQTGLCLDPYFSATKLGWMLDHLPRGRARAKAGQLRFGTVESFLLARMTGEHRTDVTNASRTLLMDLRKCTWDEDLLKVFRIPASILPEVFPSAVEYGKTKSFAGLPDGIPVTGLIGDQQAALFGQACFKPGMMKCTYGTGAFIVANTGNKPVWSRHQLLTTVAWKLGKETTYALEGSAFIAGAAVQWFRDGMGAIQKSSEIEGLAGEVPDSDGVVFVPALSGMGAPHWLPHATGLFTGLTRRTTKAHMARAVLEGIAFQIAELVDAMNRDFGRKLGPLRVDGGAAANGLMMQFQADICATEVVRSEISETTALGAGLQAGLGVGLWKNFKEISSLWKASETFKPRVGAKQRTLLRDRWDGTIAGLQHLAQL